MAIVTLLSKLEISFFNNLLGRKLCWLRISQDGLQLANLDYQAEDYWRVPLAEEMRDLLLFITHL